MKLFFSFFVALASSAFDFADAHGYLSSPRSRMFYASEEGGIGVGVPREENDPQSIDRKATNQICGSKAQNYDDYRDSRGNPMPWIPQGVYSEGQEIEIVFHLTVSHWGHIELYVCPDGNASTQECLIRNPLTMVKDLVYDGPRDSAHPERGYIGSPKAGTFRFTYRLPRGITGDKVMMQWRYVTSNSCLPPGYRNNSELISKGWARIWLEDCRTPLNWTGQGLPEQFFNCAEIAIGSSNPTTPRPPTPVPPTPVPPPSTGPGTCGNGQRGNGQCTDPNKCCSEWGWCGISRDHCKNQSPLPVPTPTPPSGGTSCGCNSCTSSVLDRDANGYKVGGRIDWLEAHMGMSEQDACRVVCRNEFPRLCAECNPDQCGSAPTPNPGPGTCGNGNVGNGRCPNQLCCSKWGWCGSSPAHCNK